jgi:uncharacterized protein (DUF1697 family)
MRQVLLLRGINLGGRNRVAMAALRDLLADAGFADVGTYLQSGNVVLESEASPEQLAHACQERIAERFGLNVDVVARTGGELAEVVRRNPLANVAKEPKRYQVSFCAAEPHSDLAERLGALAAPGEEVVVIGREVYAWHPDGVGRSRLAAELAGRRLGVVATARNWSTVVALLSMVDE